MNLFAIIEFTDIFVAVYIGTYVFAKDTSSKLNRLFFLDCLLAAFTAYCEYFRLTADSEVTAMFWSKLSFLWPFFPALYTKLALELTESEYRKKTSFTLLLIFPALLISYIYLFSDLLYEKLIFTGYGWIPVVYHSPFFIIIPVYESFTAVFSLVTIIRYFKKQKERKKRSQVFYAAIGLTIPFLVGFFSEGILPQLGTRLPPITATAFLLGIFFIAVSLVKYNIFLADPLLTMHQIFATIKDLLIVYDLNGKVIHASDSFLKCFSESDKDVSNLKLSEFLYYGPNPINLKDLELTGKELELSLIGCDKEVIPISVITSVIDDHSRNDRYFLLLGRDLRERKRFEKELFNMQKELENKVIARTIELAKANHKLKMEIDERINIEQALRESEKSYKDLFNNTPIGIFRTTPDWRILLVNPALVQMLRYNSLQEILQVNLETDKSFMDAETRVKFKQEIEKKGEIKGYESRWVRKDNTVISVRENARCIYDENGTVLFYDGTVEDITAQLEAAEALKESEEKFKILAEQSPNLIAIYCDKKIIYINERCLELTGYNKEYFISKEFNFKNLIMKISFKSLNSEEYLSGAKALTDDITLKHKDGRIVEGLISLRNINYSGKKAILIMMTDITERVKIEKELKESEEKYRGLIENINEIYYVAGNHGRVKYVSPNIELMLGFTSEEIIGQTAFKLVYKPDLNRVLKYCWDAVQKGKIDLTVEFLAIKKDGSVIWVEQLTRILRGLNGNITEYRSVVRDISERKNTENALKESEERYRSIFENTSAVMLLIDPFDGSIKGANRAASNYYGYNNSEFLRMNVSDIDVSTNIDPILFLINPNENRKENFHHRLANGEIRDVEVHSGLIKINHKEVIFSIVADITKRRRAEQQLEEYKTHLENLVAERTRKLNDVNLLLEKEINKLKTAEDNIKDQYSFLRTLLDTIPNPIFMRDTNKIFTDCNKAYEIFHGISKEQLVGRTVYDIPAIKKAEFIDKKDDEVLKNPGSIKFEITATDCNGDEHDLLVYRTTFNKNDGTLGGIVGILIDITEIKALEKEIRLAFNKEKELSELKSRFISVASHEFRTPLTSILASADLLEMYGREWPDIKYYEYIKNIQNAVEYMVELLNDVLTVSRSESGKIKFNPISIDLYSLCEKIIEDIKLGTNKKNNFIFEYNIEENIFLLDNKLITQILTNILSNAVKYSSENSNINLIIDKKDDSLSLTVIDEGIGIPEEDLKHLFEPFHRGQNVGAISGSGLGLSIAKKSAEIHHGDLFIESRINVGTKVTIILNID